MFWPLFLRPFWLSTVPTKLNHDKHITRSFLAEKTRDVLQRSEHGNWSVGLCPIQTEFSVSLNGKYLPGLQCFDVDGWVTRRSSGL